MLARLALITGLAAAPALPAAAMQRALCRPGPYLVFFDPGSHALTPGAPAVLDNVARADRDCGTQLLVSGHTDRSGSDQANLALSRRMADTVRAYLVARGIPERRIRVVAFGESQPLQWTPDGERHSHNRRVEVTFGPE